MPTPLANRTRCARACEACKRRKERCDGVSPCQRCLQRDVAGSCHFTRPKAARQGAKEKNMPQSRTRSDLTHRIIGTSTNTFSDQPLVAEQHREHPQELDTLLSANLPWAGLGEPSLLQDPSGRYGQRVQATSRNWSGLPPVKVFTPSDRLAGDNCLKSIHHMCVSNLQRFLQADVVRRSSAGFTSPIR